MCCGFDLKNKYFAIFFNKLLRNRYICPMNNTVLLVNEWADFEKKHPEASIEDFCRYYLTTQRSKNEHGPNFGGGGIPPTPKAFLMKLLGFISRVSMVYFDKAFETLPEIKQKDDFFFLNIIKNGGECRKTDVINQHMLGLSTGIDTLNRLIHLELVEERIDPSDKRAKLLRITPEGEKVLYQCYFQAGKVNEIMFHKLSDEDARLCIQLLRGVEAEHSPMVLELKDKTLDEIYAKVVVR